MNFSAPLRESASGLPAITSRRRRRAWEGGNFPTAVVLLLWIASGLAARAEDPKTLAEALEQVRAKYALPALAAATVSGVKVMESAAIGARKVGGAEKVTIDDRWHIGSCTKSMTATLAAMLVERGQIQWTSTVGELFPELHDSIEPLWAGVTLEQLLTHRAGAPEKPPENLWRVARMQQGTPTEQRLQFVRGLLLRRPETPPGTAFAYSNQGYSIAGAMLERRSGEPWESLLRAMLFPACVMPQAGFGAPASPGKVDQPWGHLRENGALVPVPPGRQADNPPAIGPGGTVHCTIEELARYAAWHARGDRAGTASLKKESFVKLHTPAAGGDYALGWRVLPRGWAGGNALTHNGSNTMFYAVIWIAPARGLALVAATNCAGEEAAKACDEAVSLLLSRQPK